MVVKKKKKKRKKLKLFFGLLKSRDRISSIEGERGQSYKQLVASNYIYTKSSFTFKIYYTYLIFIHSWLSNIY